MKIEPLQLQPLRRLTEPAAQDPSQPFEALLGAVPGDPQTSPEEAFEFVELGMFGRIRSVSSIPESAPPIAPSTDRIDMSVRHPADRDEPIVAAVGPVMTPVRGPADRGAPIVAAVGAAAIPAGQSAAPLSGAPARIGPAEAAAQPSPAPKMPARPASPIAAAPVSSARLAIARAEPAVEPAEPAPDSPEAPDAPSGDREPLSLAVFESEKMVKLTAFARGLDPAERARLLVESEALLREHGLTLGQFRLDGENLPRSTFDPTGDADGPRTN
ncbi:MAG TPA: hypothetical protein VIT45_16740 [Allosphingosinicella sp.]